MRLLVICCHPAPDSFGAGLRDAVLTAASAAGHEADLIDLAAQDFDPVLREGEWRSYADPAALPPDLAPHVAALRRAEGLILIHPTWWGGPPAQLKGWLDRVLRPGVAFVTRGATGLAPGLPGIRLIGVVTTLGSPRWAWVLLGSPGRRMILRGLRPCVARRARTFWLGLHAMDATTPADRRRFLARVAQRIAGLR